MYVRTLILFLVFFVFMFGIVVNYGKSLFGKNNRNKSKTRNEMVRKLERPAIYSHVSVFFEKMLNIVSQKIALGFPNEAFEEAKKIGGLTDNHPLSVMSIGFTRTWKIASGITWFENYLNDHPEEVTMNILEKISGWYETASPWLGVDRSLAFVKNSLEKYPDSVSLNCSLAILLMQDVVHNKITGPEKDKLMEEAAVALNKAGSLREKGIKPENPSNDNDFQATQLKYELGMANYHAIMGNAGLMEEQVIAAADTAGKIENHTLDSVVALSNHAVIGLGTESQDEIELRINKIDKALRSISNADMNPMLVVCRVGYATMKGIFTNGGLLAEDIRKSWEDFHTTEKTGKEYPAYMKDINRSIVHMKGAEGRGAHEEGLAAADSLEESLLSGKTCLSYHSILLPRHMNMLNIYRGDFYKDMGNIEMSAASYRKALTFCPNDPVTMKRLDSLKQIA